MKDPQEIVDLLNDLLDRDPEAVSTLVQSQVLVNEELAEHPTVTVGDYEHTEGPTLGPIGLINGLIEDRSVRLAYVVEEDTGEIQRFTLIDEEQFS